MSSIWNNLIYNLWQIHTISNDTDSKRSSSRCFQGYKFASSSNGFAHAFSYILFSFRTIFFLFFNRKRFICTPKLCNKNIGHHARLRAKDHRTCWACPLVEKNLPCARAYPRGVMGHSQLLSRVLRSFVFGVHGRPWFLNDDVTKRPFLCLASFPARKAAMFNAGDSLFHMHHSPSYLSREHMNPKLTCSQRQWLHSSVGRASHRYREVTGSSPVEVLNFFQASLRNCKNCDHKCEDHSSFDFISAVHIWFISYASFTFISFTGTYEPKIDLLPTSVAS